MAWWAHKVGCCVFVNIWVRDNMKILLGLSPLYLPPESRPMCFLVSYEIEIQGSRMF